MSTNVRTITTTMNPADTTAAAEKVAEVLRAEGKTVEVGEVYDNVSVRWYGMPSVDLRITEPDPPSAPAAEAEVPPEDAPEPMPVAEFGGSAPVNEPSPESEQPAAAEATGESVSADLDTESDATAADTVETEELEEPEEPEEAEPIGLASVSEVASSPPAATLGRRQKKKGRRGR